MSYTSAVRQVRIYILTDDGHFEHLLNRILFSPFSFFIFVLYIFYYKKACSDDLEFQISVAP
jgi:hypothetical protein